MKMWRWVAGIVCACSIVLFVTALPLFYLELRDHCVGQPCTAFYDKPPTAEWLQAHGMTSSTFAAGYTAVYGLFGLVFLFVGLVIFRYKSREFIGLVASVALVTQGLVFASLTEVLTHLHPLVKALVKVIETIAFLSLMLLCFTFPNGRFSPRWTRYIPLAIFIPGALRALFPQTVLDISYLSQGLFYAWTLLWMATLLVMMIYRYRKVLDPVEKQQAKWAFFGMFSGILCLLLLTVVFVTQAEAIEANPLLLFTLESSLLLGMMLIPATLLMALLKRRLWDIDAVLYRTLLYGALTAFVAGVYILGVWYVGSVFRSASPWFTSLIATGIVAVLFAPLKEKLQRGVNRLIYGDNDDPLSVLGTLGKKLENPLTPQDALRVVARTVKEALRLPYAGLTIDRDGESLAVAEEGSPAGEPLRLPLVHRGERIGELLVSPRSQGESFTASDRRFLDMLVRQAGAVVQSATASLDLVRAAEDLRESRERLVLAREEERRRLRANLHDDLAPRLAALAFTASAAETLLTSDPGRTKTILVELQTVIRSTVADIRRLVHDLRPPALDELGLVGAIRERIHDLSRPVAGERAGGGGYGGGDAGGNGGGYGGGDGGGGGYGGGAAEFRFDAPKELPPLPAAVEVAAFRIVTEALVNVVRHSGARRCEVRISLAPEPDAALLLEIADDGKGLGGGDRRNGAARHVQGPGGIGLPSMRERAEELGGTCRIENLDPAGVRVWARLPLSQPAPKAEEGSESA